MRTLSSLTASFRRKGARALCESDQQWQRRLVGQFFCIFGHFLAARLQKSFFDFILMVMMPQLKAKRKLVCLTLENSLG